MRITNGVPRFQGQKLSQSLSRRPTADKEPEKLWARDCLMPEKIPGIPAGDVNGDIGTRLTFEQF